jgi:hypothetical protein
MMPYGSMPWEYCYRTEKERRVAEMNLARDSLC